MICRGMTYWFHGIFGKNYSFFQIVFADEFKTELSNIHQFSAGNPDSGRLLHSGRIHVGAVMGGSSEEYYYVPPS